MMQQNQQNVLLPHSYAPPPPPPTQLANSSRHSNPNKCTSTASDRKSSFHQQNSYQNPQQMHQFDQQHYIYTPSAYTHQSQSNHFVYNSNYPVHAPQLNPYTYPQPQMSQYHPGINMNVGFYNSHMSMQNMQYSPPMQQYPVSHFPHPPHMNGSMNVNPPVPQYEISRNQSYPEANRQINGHNQSNRKPQEQGIFNCEPCSKSFKVRSQLLAHLKTHVKCSECEFEASGRVVTSHKEEEHGLSKDGRPVETVQIKIKLDTPEEIAKWREERKRNYPTDKNIEKKKTEEQKRIERGELPRQDGKKRKNKFDRSGSGSDKRRKVNEIQDEVQRQPESQPIPTALASISTYADSPKTPNSDSDSDIDPERDAISSKPPSELQSKMTEESAKKNTRICKHWRKTGNCRFGENCKFRHDPGVKSTQSSSSSNQSTSTTLLHRRPPLLQSLLQKEIRIEKSQLLQCIRFILRNQFFENGMVFTGDESNELNRVEVGKLGSNEVKKDENEKGMESGEITDSDPRSVEESSSDDEISESDGDHDEVEEEENKEISDELSLEVKEKNKLENEISAIYDVPFFSF
ncbi:hypothetical protein BKA69DRAFT_1122063 [Paraphysoderma sedebokerense]|nr:hypothetical protein BKA69DRAFT_1122063 [Paraphysoderma sedebokerense]